MNIYENIRNNLNEKEAPQNYERGNAPFESKRVPEDRIREDGYQYFSTHGLGPGTHPRDVRVRELDIELPSGWVTFKTDRPLTSEELDWYDIQPETKNSYYRKRFGLEESNLKESEDYGFDEIIDMMSSAEDYETLYNAANYIKDDDLRVDVEQCIEQCEEDGDDVDVAYSVTTSDYLDMYAMQGIANTPTTVADYKASLKKESENLDEAIEQKYRKSNDNYNEFLRDVKKYTGSYDYLYGGSVSTECYEYPVTVKYFYYNRPYAGGGYNLVVNVLTPMDSMAGGEIQEAIENAFEDNAKSPLSNREIKEKILQTVKEVDAQNNLSEANLEPQYSTRKSFYGKANVNDDNTLVSYGTPIMKIEDGKIQMLCRPEHLTQTTIRHIREFMQQNGMDPLPKNKLVKMIEDQGNINESEDTVPNITYLFDRYNWEIDIDSKESLGMDYNYHTLLTSVDDAEKFNYHSDYWGNASDYENDMVNLVSDFEPYIGKKIQIDYDDGESREFTLLGVLVDNQYNDSSHAKILVDDLHMNESEEKSPKQNKIPRNWKKISGEMVGDSSGGKAGDKFEITKDEYDRPIMKYEDGKEYQANWSMIRSPEMVKITNIELNESESLKESSNIIWSSETTEDDYDPEELKERYQEYLDGFEAEEDEETGEVSEPKDFENWKYDYIADDSYDQWDMKKEDLEENIYPMIDKQINNDILIVSGNYNSNYPDFRPSGKGGKFLNKAEDILDWLSDEDRIDFTNTDGILGVNAYDHDGSIGGLLYTLPDDDKLLLEIAKATDYYEVDATDDEILDEFKYDLTNGNIDMSNFRGYEDRFIPITVSW